MKIDCGEIVLQDIYRVLCKFALSVLEDEELLEKFEWTTNWISKKFSVENLPTVKTLFTYAFYPENPTVQLFIRKTSNEELPLLFTIFYYKSLVYLYIVPSNRDECIKFSNVDNFSAFWEYIPFAGIESWTDRNLSNDNSVPLTYHINFEQRGSNVKN